MEDVGLELESKDIELSYFNYVDKDVLVIADAEQIKRVINNIIGNSIKYLDKPKGIMQYPCAGCGRFYSGRDRGQWKGHCGQGSAVYF